MEYLKSKTTFTFVNIGLLIIPLIIMLSNVIFKNEFIVDNIWFYSIIYLGYFSLIMSIYYIYINIIKNKIRINYKEIIPIILLFIFMIITLISVLINNPFISFYGDTYRHEGYFTYLAYAGFFLGALFVSKDKNKYYQLFVIIGTILSIFTINKNDIFNLFVNESQEYKAIFYQFNHFGYFLLMAIICNINLFVNEKRIKYKIIYALTFSLMMQMLVINDTFGSYLAVLASLIFLGIYYLFINKNRKNYLIVFVLFIIMSFNLNDIKNSNVINNFKDNFSSLLSIDINNLDEEELKKINHLGTNRGALWRGAVKLIEKKPFIGYGLDNSRTQYFKIGLINADRPHNIILQMCLYTGIPGMILYISSLLIIIYETLKKIKILPISIIISFSVVIGYLTSSLTSNSMFYTSPYFLIFLGFVMGSLINFNKDNVNLNKNIDK
ncbi:MAG: O-antigen ligase family protein [Bacilli bacterium]|nr:O-antigen ligase family protein [Bacilli bacterium]